MALTFRTCVASIIDARQLVLGHILQQIGTQSERFDQIDHYFSRAEEQNNNNFFRFIN